MNPKIRIFILVCLSSLLITTALRWTLDTFQVKPPSTYGIVIDKDQPDTWEVAVQDNLTHRINFCKVNQEEYNHLKAGDKWGCNLERD